ncbi:MAG: VOC family protein [Dehalococcoidia bacterium]
MAKLGDIVVDCAKPAPLARFWAAVLDGYEIEPYDDEEIARLKSLGIDDLENDPGVAMRHTTGGGPRFFFQQVPEPKTVKNRLHLDLRPDNRAAEVARLMALGASKLRDVQHDSGGAWTVMQDPQGNEFCVMEP